MAASQTQAAVSRVQAWFNQRTRWQRHGIALVAGALATLAHAPFQLTGFFVVAIVLFVWLLDAVLTQHPQTSWKRFASAFGTGWWFGLGHMTTGLYWVSSAFMVDSASWGPIWGVPMVLLLAAVCGVFFGLGAGLASFAWTNDARRIAVFAVCLFVSEWLRGNLILGGFPWLLPGYVWTPGEPVSQLASVVGIYGLTLLTLLVCAAPAAVADGGVPAARRFAPTLIAALLVGLGFGWGAQRLATASVDPPGAQPIVRVADSGLSQAEKWRYNPDQERYVLQRYLEASGAADDSRAAILVWPEGAIPTLNFFMLDNPAFMQTLGQGLGDRVLVTGLSRCEPQPQCDAFMRGQGVGEQLRLYNSAAVIDGVSGVARISQTYDKHHLVPGGEYIPFWSLVSRLNIAPLQRIGAGFTAGEPPTRLVIPGAPSAIVLICYEAIFPGMTPRGEERPGWIISVTNDAWFGDGTGPHQHFAMARYRAIEEGLPLARAASGGISAIVDAYGRTVRSTQRRGGFAEAQLPPALVETTLARRGNILLILLVVLIGLGRFLPRT